MPVVRDKAKLVYAVMITIQDIIDMWRQNTVGAAYTMI